MMEYIREIKRQFRDQYGFKPTDERMGELVFAEGQIPDGEYPMTINGRTDRVKIESGMIRCGNFDTEANADAAKWTETGDGQYEATIDGRRVTADLRGEKYKFTVPDENGGYLATIQLRSGVMEWWKRSIEAMVRTGTL